MWPPASLRSAATTYVFPGCWTLGWLGVITLSTVLFMSLLEKPYFWQFTTLDYFYLTNEWGSQLHLDTHMRCTEVSDLWWTAGLSTTWGNNLLFLSLWWKSTFAATVFKLFKWMLVISFEGRWAKCPVWINCSSENECFKCCTALLTLHEQSD